VALTPDDLQTLYEAIDVIRRCRRMLNHVTQLQLCPSAWDGISRADEPYLHHTGPKWKGLPGTYPLTKFATIQLERKLDALAGRLAQLIDL
jgi:hypothetical protein